MKELLNELKEELLNNSTDYTLLDLFNDEDKQAKYVKNASGKLKQVNPTYKKSIEILIKEIKGNFKEYVEFNWDKIEEKYKEII